MPARPPRRDEDAVRRFVEHIAVTMSDYGFPRMAARVLFTMMSAEEVALTAHQLCERLAVSPAAISGAVRYLTHLGLLVREPVPGSRRDQFRLADDTWYETTAAKSRMLRQLSHTADAGVAALGGEDTRAGARVAVMRDFFTFVCAEMETMLERWNAAKETRDPSAVQGTT